MKSNTVQPPALPVRRASRARGALAALLGLVLLAEVVIRFQLPVPACPLRATTGVPCPFCGSTRAFAALAHLDFATALRLNPFVSLAASAAAAGWLWAMRRGAAVSGGPSFDWLARPLGRWLLACALAGNWLYLWLTLPR